MDSHSMRNILIKCFVERPNLSFSEFSECGFIPLSLVAVIVSRSLLRKMAGGFLEREDIFKMSSDRIFYPSII